MLSASSAVVAIDLLLYFSVLPEIVFESGGSGSHVLIPATHHGLNGKHILSVNDINREQVGLLGDLF